MSNCFKCKHLKDISLLEDTDAAYSYAADSKWFCNPVESPTTCWGEDEQEAMSGGGFCDAFEEKEGEVSEGKTMYNMFNRKTERYMGTVTLADPSMLDDPKSSFIYQEAYTVPVLRKPVLPDGCYLVTIAGQGSLLHVRRKISTSSYALIAEGDGRSYRGVWDQQGYTVVAKIDMPGIHWVGKDE